MRLVRRDHERDRCMAIDITAMIDVVFLLIAFFLTTAQFAQMTRAEVDLPRERGEKQEEAEQGIVVNLMPDGRIIIDDREYDLAGLKQLMLTEVKVREDERGGRMTVTIRADRTLSSTRLNQVVRALQEVGVDLGRFATQVPG